MNPNIQTPAQWLLAAPKFARGALYADFATLAQAVNTDPTHQLNGLPLPPSAPTASLVIKRIKLDSKSTFGADPTPIKGRPGALRLHFPDADRNTLTQRSAVIEIDEHNRLVEQDISALTADELKALRNMHHTALTQALADAPFNAHIALQRVLKPLEVGSAYLYAPETAERAAAWYRAIGAACRDAQVVTAPLDLAQAPELAAAGIDGLRGRIQSLIDEARERLAAGTKTRAATHAERLQELQEAVKQAKAIQALHAQLGADIAELEAEAREAINATLETLPEAIKARRKRATPAPAPTPAPAAPAPKQEPAPALEPIHAAAESAGAIPPESLLLWTDNAAQLVVINPRYGAFHARWTGETWAALPTDASPLLPPTETAMQEAHTHRGILPPCASAYTLVNAGLAQWIEAPNGAHPYARLND